MYVMYNYRVVYMYNTGGAGTLDISYMYLYITLCTAYAVPNQITKTIKFRNAALITHGEKAFSDSIMAYANVLLAAI